MKVLEKFEGYSRYIAKSRIMKLLKEPTDILPEEVKSIIPSIELLSSGPELTSVFVFTNKYICEIRNDTKQQEFDYSPLNSIKNIKFTIQSKTVNLGDDEDVIYMIAKIQLLHHISVNAEFASRLTYVGDDYKDWINIVKEVIPLHIMDS